MLLPLFQTDLLGGQNIQDFLLKNDIISTHCKFTIIKLKKTSRSFWNGGSNKEVHVVEKNWQSLIH